MRPLHIITPVKDSIGLAVQTFRSVLEAELPPGSKYTVYNDRSTPGNRTVLENTARQYGFHLVHLEDITDNPSPNYLTVLRMARRDALAAGAHLLIIESDVTVRPDTVTALYGKATDLPVCGMAAAVTVDRDGHINYPYDKMGLPFQKYSDIPTRKHLSFCCTLLTVELLERVDFERFDASKSWFDVTVSRESLKRGLANYACTGIRVLHQPHGSRPWKQLKYKNPLKYYWLKIIKKRDRI